jgi:tetraacyldisaccharide 4'-kinase
MKLYKPSFWGKKNSFIAYLLFPISIIVQLLRIIKNNIVKTKKYNVPIFCIGNIYLGGTGKTPMAIKIFELLKQIDKRPAIIKKFYKSQIDEIKLLENKTKKIFYNKSRDQAIQEAIRQDSKTIILDDGFQDNSIKKDLQMLCFNENQLIGNGFTIPSGPLREPFSSIKNSSIIFINGKPNLFFEKKINEISKEIEIYYFNYKALNLEDFKNKKIMAFAGIGNPENFFKLLEKYNLNIKKKVSFPDHYGYKNTEIEKLISHAKENNFELITTEKDYFRIKHLHSKNIKYLKIQIDIENEKKQLFNI